MSRKFKIALLTIANVNIALAVLNFCALFVGYDRMLLLQGIAHTRVAAYLQQWVSYERKISEIYRKDSDRSTAQNSRDERV